MEDKKLLQRLKKDPSEGLEILMEQYMGLVIFIVKNHTETVCTKEDMEDCVSDIFTAFYQQINVIDLSKGTIKAYLCQIAVRTAIHLYKERLAESQMIFTDEDAMERAMSEYLLPEEIYLPEESRKELMHHIEELGEVDRDIIVSRYYRGENSGSIAKRHKMTVSAVDTRMHRALKKIKKSLGGDFNV